MNTRIVLLAVVLGSVPPAMSSAFAQTSDSFKVQEHVLNAGGNPDGGQVLASSSFRVSLDSIGEGVTGPGLSSTLWRMDGGFVSAYPPPGEVMGVRFAPDHITLSWMPERSVGSYDLYRGVVPAFLPGYGTCNQLGLTAETAVDTDLPSIGAGFFYLLTARNRLREEGTKGFNSSGIERLNPIPCP